MRRFIVYRVAIFAYDFPHHKTNDFIVESKLSGVELAGVIGAPRKALPSYGHFIGYRPLPQPAPRDTAAICASFGLKYVTLDHGDAHAIGERVRRWGANLAIIAGARILDAAVIEHFRYGIINFHPGKIPETSGLDAFYWMLEKGAPAGVTAHLIDRKVDAGQFLFFEGAMVDSDDTLATIAYKIYVAQLVALRRVFDTIRKKEPFESTQIERPNKNPPMSDAQRAAAVAKFDQWKRRFASS